VCADLSAALDLLQAAGFRLDVIYPADDPHSAVLTLGERTVRLTRAPGGEKPSNILPDFQP